MWYFRKIRAPAALILALGTVSVSATTVEVDVEGLTCAFCVGSLQQQLRKLPGVEQVQVSLKTKKVRIVSSAEHLDTQLIKQTVVDAGFTPGAIKVLEDDH